MPAIEAVIKPESPRRDFWVEAIGSDRIPLRELSAHRALGPDGTPRHFYRADLSRFSLAARARIARALAGRFGGDPEEIARDLDGPHGLPILAEDVVVAVDARVFL